MDKDVDGLEDVLDLEDLIDDLKPTGPNAEQLYQLYGVYLSDIVNTPIILNSKPIKFNNKLSKNPLCRGKHETFEHIITRKSAHSDKRNFDLARANKIHWIKPIIENAHDARILYFEKVHYTGHNQFFYWYKTKGFLIIVREIKADCLLITAFSVDQMERKKYETWYDEYQKKTPLRK